MVLTSTHKLCFEQKNENIRVFFLSENFQFLEVTFSIYSNRPVFVMFSNSKNYRDDSVEFLRILRLMTHCIFLKNPIYDVKEESHSQNIDPH